MSGFDNGLDEDFEAFLWENEGSYDEVLTLLNEIFHNQVDEFNKTVQSIDDEQHIGVQNETDDLGIEE